MITLDYITLTHSELPIIKNIELNGIYYGFEFKYNARSDFYTVVMRDIETDEILYTTKLVYDEPVIHVVSTNLPITDVLIPVNFEDLFSTALTTTELNSTTLDNPVKLYLVPDGEIVES